MISSAQFSTVRKSTKGVLPNLIIIGAMKCATTSLHYYLGLHPQISMSREKELNFFVSKHNWHKGIEWYQGNFAGNAKIYGESSPMYTNHPGFGGVPERMFSVVPQAKLIYILRDPVERIISDYVHNYADGRENRPIVEALTRLNNDNAYVRRSKYYMQLEQYLNYFPESNILIITQEDLHRQRRLTLKTVLNFLNLDDFYYSRKFSINKHKSRYKRRKNWVGIFLAQTLGANFVDGLPPQIREKAKILLYFPFSNRIERPVLDRCLRQRLIDYLSDDIHRLRAYTGRNFENWCV